jgi:hypothetical protein
MNILPSDVLRSARNLITEPSKWTQNHFAKDENGNALLDGYAQQAVCWCSIGALEKVVGGCVPSYDKPSQLLMKAGAILTGCQKYNFSISAYNDSHTHQEVLNLFDTAIAIASTEE